MIGLRSAVVNNNSSKNKSTMLINAFGKRVKADGGSIENGPDLGKSLAFLINK